MIEVYLDKDIFIFHYDLLTTPINTIQYFIKDNNNF